MKRLLLFTFAVLLITVSCKKEETTEPGTMGKISGYVTEFATDSIIYKANVFTEPATSYVATDENGKYTIYNVEPGEYTVTAAKSGYDTLKVGVTVVAGKTTTADFILHRTDSLNNQIYGSIAGKVINAVTSQPVNEVTLYTSPATVVLLTQNDGSFRFERLTPGAYILYAKKQGYDSLSISISVEAGFESEADLTLTPSDTTEPPRFAIIEGYIINSVTGVPIDKAIISGTPSFGSFFSDSTGYYKIENLSPGNYSVSVSKTYFQTATSDITLNAGDNIQLNFMLTPTVGNIDGTVIDSTGAPLPDVIITTNPQTGSFLTDVSGKFTIENIEAGAITITAEKAGFATKSVDVTIEAGLTRQVVIMLGKD